MASYRGTNYAARGDVVALQAAALDATGHWVAGLADFRYFITLTHRLVAPRGPGQPVTSREHRSGFSAYTRIGLARHNGLMRDFFHEIVRPGDPSAQWWSETELHASGQPHEHALLACSDSAGVYGWLDAYFKSDGGGIWNCQPFSRDPDERVRAACYVEKAMKYAGKAAVQPPKVWGFHSVLPARSTWSGLSIA